jgi:hypothetical protein
VSVALAHQPGIEGGIWQRDSSLAYACPTYAGTGLKTDLPAAELDRIRSVNQEAIRTEQPVLSRTVSRTQTLLLFACPLDGPLQGLTGWTMTRVEAAPVVGQKLASAHEAYATAMMSSCIIAA